MGCVIYNILHFWLTDNNIVLLLQAKLQEFLGRRELDKHLDADEAIVLGASLHAANLSDGIKLNRKLGMIDGSTYALVLEIDGPGYVKDESIDQTLVPRMKKMPIKVSKAVFLLSSNCGRTLHHVSGRIHLK